MIAKNFTAHSFLSLAPLKPQTNKELDTFDSQVSWFTFIQLLVLSLLVIDPSTQRRVCFVFLRYVAVTVLFFGECRRAKDKRKNITVLGLNMTCTFCLINP